MSKSIASPILSICIPTWNRAKFLNCCLKAIEEQLKDIESSELELYVSDNCSKDNTEDVVNDYIKKGLPITYNKNAKNLGAAGNFLKCMQFASGKYILLLGDDDILYPDAIRFLLDLLRNNDYGIVHFCPLRKNEHTTLVFDNKDEFFINVSYWFTFISGNIFQKKVVPQISPEGYYWTHLLQMPYYIKSALSSTQNVIVYKDILKISLDGDSNGGYNFYEVFVDGYLSIWSEFLNRHEISKDVYDALKRDLYEKMVYNYNMKLLIHRKGVKDAEDGKRGTFMVNNAWKILFRNYGNKAYFWVSFPKLFFQSIKQTIWLAVKGNR